MPREGAKEFVKERRNRREEKKNGQEVLIKLQQHLEFRSFVGTLCANIPLENKRR